jgi:hypothetical protein
MTEVVNTPKKRGRKPRDPNAPVVKREAKGRKYYVMPADQYEAFVQGQETHVSLEAAMKYADSLATSAEDSGNPNLRLAVFEEAGILSAQVEKKVVRNFASSRTLTRQGSPEGAQPEPDAQQGSATSAEPSAQGSTATSESTPSEEPQPRRRRG